MPQISQIGEIYASQLFWLAIFFGAIFVVIGLGMLPKIIGTVDARDAKIAADLKSAEGARAAADALEEALETDDVEQRLGHRELRAGRHLALEPLELELEVVGEASVGEADKAIGVKLDQAMQRIGEARVSAMAEIEAVASQAVQELTAKVAGLTVDDATAKAAVAKELVHG